MLASGKGAQGSLGSSLRARFALRALREFDMIYNVYVLGTFLGIVNETGEVAALKAAHLKWRERELRVEPTRHSSRRKPTQPKRRN